MKDHGGKSNFFFQASSFFCCCKNESVPPHYNLVSNIENALELHFYPFFGHYFLR